MGEKEISKIIRSEEVVNQELSNLLEKTLTISKDKINVPSTGENLTLFVIIDRIKRMDLNSYAYQKALEEYLLNDLFSRWEKAKGYIEFVIKKKMFNTEELISALQECEKELKAKDKEIEKLEKGLAVISHIEDKLNKLMPKAKEEPKPEPEGEFEG